MKLTRGERRSLVLYLFVLAGFLPPVIILFNRADVKVFGMPLLLFWVGLMVLLTSVSSFTRKIEPDRLERFERLLAEKDGDNTKT